VTEAIGTDRNPQMGETSRPATTSDATALLKQITAAIHRYDHDHLLTVNDIPGEHHRGEAAAVLAIPEMRQILAQAARLEPAIIEQERQAERAEDAETRLRNIAQGGPRADAVQAEIGEMIAQTHELRDQLRDTAAVLGVRDRDMRVLADEVTRLSAITGQLRDLATRWQATVRPGEQHPAAAAILNILDGDGPSVAEAAANDRRWPYEKAGE